MRFRTRHAIGGRGRTSRCGVASRVFVMLLAIVAIGASQASAKESGSTIVTSSASAPVESAGNAPCGSRDGSACCASAPSSGADRPAVAASGPDGATGNGSAHTNCTSALSTINRPDRYNLPDLGAGKTAVTSKDDATRRSVLTPVLQQLTQFGSSAAYGQSMTDIGLGYLTGRANQYMFGGLQRWLSQFGTANVSMSVDNHGRLTDGSTNFLLPLYDDKGSWLVFTQLGYLRWDGRNTINVGLGARHFDNDWMNGVNAFFDDDLTGHNQRVGAGVELAANYLKFSANGYLGLTNWHRSLDYIDYDERPANGFDVASQMYLPSLPQLGVKLKYEQYFGSGVDLLGSGDRQKNPFAVTAGLEYTPVPAVTVGAAYRRGTGSISDVLFNVQLNYRLGVPLAQQFDPRAVGSMRTLAGSRYDLVQRNNRIVLDYRKHVEIRLSLGGALSGYAGQVIAVPVAVTATYGLQSIQWSAPELFARGGTVSGTNGSYFVTLPSYQPGGNNTYTIRGVAVDQRGNASSPAEMQVTVIGESAAISADQSSAAFSPDRIYADGRSTSTLTITVVDTNGNGVAGLAQDIDLQAAFNGGSTTQAQAGGSAITGGLSQQPRIGSITDLRNGIYVATVTAGTSTGTLTVTPLLRNEKIKLKAAPLMLVAPAQHSVKITNVSVTPQGNVAADGNAYYTFTAQVVDATTGLPVKNDPLVGLNWQVSPKPSTIGNAGWLVLTPGSSTTDDSGRITATLKSKIDDTAFTVSAQLGAAAPVSAPPVTFTVAARVAAVRIVVPSSGNYQIATLNNDLNIPVYVHAPLAGSGDQGFQYVATVVDARNLPVANRSLTSLGVQWLPSRSPSGSSESWTVQPTTNGAGEAIAVYRSWRVLGSDGPLSVSVQAGNQAAMRATGGSFDVVAFSDLPREDHQVQYVNSAGQTGSVLPAMLDTQATIYVTGVTFVELAQMAQLGNTDTVLRATSSNPSVFQITPSNLINALKPGSATVNVLYVHNGFRFTQNLSLTATFVAKVIGTPQEQPLLGDTPCRTSAGSQYDDINGADAANFFQFFSQDSTSPGYALDDIAKFWGGLSLNQTQKHFWLNYYGVAWYGGEVYNGPDAQGSINRTETGQGVMVCKVVS
ncbi:bacterial Ig-like domain family protein [Burkholderia dolosa AU0158]|nr:bacterial Ig-like domain family protein [Burkholderia dolosa AU0158]VWB13550.1 Invasin [Burkholderia dolosa]